MLLALPARHPMAARPEVDLLALAEERWIQGGIGGPCREVAQAACATAGFSPRLDHSVDDWSALLALVAAGCGVGLVPALAVGSAPPDGVVLRPLLGPQRAVRHLYAAARAGTERSPTIAPVVAAMLAVARELEATLALRTVGHGRKRAAPGEKRRR
jgi:DNA-binding transcriptional LysR family regulator